MIEADVIEKIIELGKSPSLDSPESLISLKAIEHQDYINRLHWAQWDEVTRRMPLEDLTALVKGLTVIEGVFNWAGGSVSSVIWTFREVERRNIMLSEELADWILTRTHNPYVPFGRNNHGAKSVAEYRLLQSQHQGWTARRSNEIRLNEEQARKERSIRAQQRCEAARTRDSEIREKFLKELDLLPIEKQLEQLAFDTKYPVEFYPTRIPYQTTHEITNNLDSHARKALLAKLKGRHRGPWQRFKQLLTRVDPTRSKGAFDA